MAFDIKKADKFMQIYLIISIFANNLA